MNKTIILILFIGALLRLTGLGANLSYGGIYHPDTPKQITAAWDFINNIYYTPHVHPDYRGYPMFTMHICEWVFRLMSGLYYFVSFIFGMHHGIDKTGFNILYIYLLARFILAVFSILTIYIIYKIGAKLFSPRAGILASLLFSLSPLSSSLCHYAMGDTAMVFFAVCATYFSCMIITKGGMRYYLLAGLFTMFSFSAKYNGAIVGILPIIALLYNRKNIIASISLFILGCIIGLFIGNPHLFIHLKKGIIDIFYFLKHTSNFGLSSEELGIPRALVAKSYLLENIKMLIGSLEVPVFILAISALSYLIRPSPRYIFISAFPIIYLLTAFYGKPSLQPLYLLAIFPHMFIMIGALLNSAHRYLKVPLYGIYIYSLLLYAYNSTAEDYFFWHKDTRQIAEEWVRHNISSQANIHLTGYSISNPHGSHYGPVIANFHVSSSLSGMNIPPEAIVIKKFSLENKIPPTIHRNPTIKISVIPGRGIKRDFFLPGFGKPIIDWPDPLFIFPNGIELGPSNEAVVLRKGEKKGITYVSEIPIRNIMVTITNGNSKARIRINNQRLRLGPNETRTIVFKNPRRSFPNTRYFYKIYIKNISGNEALFQFSTSHKDSAPQITAYTKKEFYKITGINPELLKAVNTQTFEAEGMYYQDNLIIKNSLYSNDNAVMLEPVEGKDILWGPYQFYTKGNYIASFTLHAQKDALAKLEVVTDAGKTILNDVEVKINGMREIQLPFEIKGTASVLEFRVMPIGTNPILIDKITIYPNLM